jgi:hypothetical protein
MDVWNNTSQGKAYKWQSGFPDATKGKCIAAKKSLLLNANCEDPMQFFCEKYELQLKALTLNETITPISDSDLLTMVWCYEYYSLRFSLLLFY